MKPLNHRTKIVATIGPASSSPDRLRQMMRAGMNVARLNFSHGSYDQHAAQIQVLRQIADELDLPLMLLQDLQGPKIRVGDLPPDGLNLVAGETLILYPLSEYTGAAHTVGIDYAHLAEDAQPGIPVLLDDGLLELQVEAIQGNGLQCRIIKGGVLNSHKGVNFPTLNLRLPSMTDKDKRDLQFGIQQGVDLISLSFVRQVEDILALRSFIADQGARLPVLAKIEKPQAIANLEAIVQECDAIMVARGDLGVEMSPEKVPMIQKRIIQLCNQKGIPVITATQMLDSMIHNPRPTRAEASDVANAIMDGTDAVMLSGESAVGEYPIEAVTMLARIATEVEAEIQFVNYPPDSRDDNHAISEALNVIDHTLDLHCIVAFTATGYTAKLAAAERPSVPIVAYTPNPQTYRWLSLVWGVRPVLLPPDLHSLEAHLSYMETDLSQRQFAAPGDKVLVLGGVPMGHVGGTNFIKLHTLPSV